MSFSHPPHSIYIVNGLKDQGEEITYPNLSYAQRDDTDTGVPSVTDRRQDKKFLTSRSLPGLSDDVSDSNVGM